jgi:hypothetical protein
MLASEVIHTESSQGISALHASGNGSPTGMSHRRAFFLHIPKTGGTALTQQLALLYEERRVQPWGARLSDLAAQFAGQPTMLARGRIWNDQAATDFDLFSRDHCTLADWERLVASVPELAKCVRFTVLREPVARAYSMLQHLRRRTPETIEGAYVAGLLSLQDRDTQLAVQKFACGLSTLEFLDLPQKELHRLIDHELRNRATRMLSTAKESASEQEHFESAVSNLEKFDVVGLQEDLDGTMQKLCMRLDVPMPPSVLDANVGHYARCIDEAVSARLRSMNELDLELYRIAASRHAVDSRELPTPERYNRAWSERRSWAGYQRDYEIEMSGPVPGWGWHCREGGVGDVPYLCWTTGVAAVYLPMSPGVQYELELHCRGTMSERNWSQTTVRVEEREFSLQLVAATNGFPMLKATIACANHQAGWKEVRIVPLETLSHHQLDATCDDRRQKGICVERIRLTPLNSA